MPQYNQPAAITTMAPSDIILVWQTASGSVKTITFNNFAETIVTAAGQGIPGGSPTQVQYNNAGVFGGISSATFDGATLTLNAPAILNPTGLVKADVGLGSVDNTSDLNKPISTATQTALNLLAPLLSPTFTGTPAAPTAILGDNTTKLATTAFVQSALAGYATGASFTITNDTATNGTMYPVWVTANSGSIPPYVSSAKLSWNPSTGILTSLGGIAFQSGTSDILQSANLITIRASGGLAIRPTTNIVSIAGTSGAADVVISDSTSFTTWQGPGATGAGVYLQRASTAYNYTLSVAASPNAGYWAAGAAGSYGALTATPTGRPFTYGVYTYGGSTWVNTSYMQFRTTQLQSESARGTAIWFTTTANGATSLRVSMIMDQDGTCLAFQPTGGLGYGTGAGGAVTQGTSRSTAVTLNTVSGDITLFSAAGSTSPTTFTVNNSAVIATDTIIINQKSGTDLYEIFVTNVGAGSFKVTFFTTGGTTTEQPVFHYNVIKGVNA